MEQQIAFTSKKDEKQKGPSSIEEFALNLVINGFIFFILLSAFFLLRKTFVRIYSPRTYVGSVPDKKQPKRLSSNPFTFFKELWSLSDRYTIGKTSLDGYLFLRLLKIVVYISSVGFIIVLPLLVVNALGSENGDGLNKFSFSNVGDDQKVRFYAHAVVSMAFFGFILLVIYRELRFYIALRNAYVISKAYSKRISARTLFVTSIPQQYLNEDSIKEVFDGVEKVWINTDVKQLNDKVEERTKAVDELETAELTYIQAVDKKRRKALKNGHDEEQRLVGSEWSSREDRPTRQWPPLIGRKLDAIEYNRKKIVNLNDKIKDLQDRQKNLDVKLLNSAFIKFKTPRMAQFAYQCVAFEVPLHMAPRYVAIHPEEVIWANTGIVWWERLVRIALVVAAITVMVIFWTVPVGLVGSLSEIDKLVEKFPFLSFINSLPESVLAVIKGFLPAALLAALMALVPIIMRQLSTFAGAPSLSIVEIQTQMGYFFFQVVQVFLVATISKSAWAVVKQLQDNPSAATSILAKNLPKSSNFYISYVVLQGLTLSASQLLQIAVLLTVKFVSPVLDNTPRKRWDRWINLASLGWGTIFPVYTNLAVITFAYAVIAPLILPFAAIGIGIFFLAYKYNFIYVYNNTIDTKGAVYPLALQQMLTGVYVGELCMLGLFSTRKVKGPIIMQLILLIATILFHITIRATMGELIDSIPINVLKRNEDDGVFAEHIDEHDYNEDTITQKFFHFLNPSPENIIELVNTVLVDIVTDHEKVEHAYLHPAITAIEPKIWIARDEAGVSKEEVENNREAGIEASDENAWIDEKGKLDWKPLKGEDEGEGEGVQVNPPDYVSKYLL